MKILFLLSLLLALPAFAAERVALVIGNTIYDSTKPKGTSPNLVTAGDDAAAMASLLEKTLSFKVILGTNLTLTGMADAVEEFKSAGNKANVTLVYFAGHGVESDLLGDNFLLPVEAKLTKEAHLKAEAYPLKTLLREVADSSAATRLVILDCCRNNPLEGRTWYSGRGAGGLAPLDKTLLDGNTMVVFSAAPGKPAKDRLQATDRHSPFAATLLSKLQERGKSCMDLFGEVEVEVFEKTDEQQRPKTFMNGNLAPFTTFFFLPGNRKPAEPTPVPTPAKPVPIPPELPGFAVAKATWSNGSLSFTLADFTLGDFTLGDNGSAAARLKVKNLSTKQIWRLALDATNPGGFNALPYYRAKILNAKAEPVHCSMPSGIFTRVYAINKWDADLLIKEQNASYDPSLVQNWLSQMNALAPGEETFVTFRFTPESGDKRADLTGKLLLQANFYGAPESDGSVGRVSKINPVFEGIKVTAP